MRLPLWLVFWSATACSALSILQPDQNVLRDKSDSNRFLIELELGVTRWITEDEKWELRREGINFMDITSTPDLGSIATTDTATRKRVVFPKKPVNNEILSPLMKDLSKSNMKKHLEKFTSFYTRYYKSSYGAESSAWLLSQVNNTIRTAGADKYGAFVKAFEHPWGQSSVIATIPGRSEKTVVIGAHQDSINLFLPSILAAPGADDDGSGSVTILEALRILLQSKDIRSGNASNTVEFHWYSAEEGGLLGSQAIFSAYEKAELTEFIKEVITEYCDIPYVLTKCGYACSDHASASKAGYPSAFVIESDFKYSDNKIHTTEDKIEYLSFDHMLQHARLTLGLAYELAFAELE
ncbi:MAG: hypothetical protein Q9190_004441 [Brigantiaea leucoxantha]